VTIGDLVLVKKDNLPPLVCKKAVISDFHAGRDGLIRVVTLRTAKGRFKRPVAKICFLQKLIELFLFVFLVTIIKVDMSDY
jgi:hypothetical protein